MTLAREMSFTFEMGRKDGAVMWKTCLPRRLERRDETLEDEDCFFADLKPDGGLKACGSINETLDLFSSG